ncbi:MAG: DUF2605 family protein [Prochlorococcaceae cyanobacterium]
MPPPPDPRDPAPGLPAGLPEEGALLESVLAPLLEDFGYWLERGEVLLAHCPDTVMPPTERSELAEALSLARRELSAARALRSAAPAPMALAMETLAPWHQLVLRVWTLGGRMRQAGIVVPPAR